MTRRLTFDKREAFLENLRRLKEEGHTWESLRIHLPYAVPEAEKIMGVPPGGLRYFAIFGGLLGFLGGMALTTFTALSYPLIVGGKPIVSIPPFLLVAYILTILFGALSAFAGFLLLARMPDRRWFASPEEFGNQFVIMIEEGEPS
jgi:hypothetical protein